MWKRTEDSQPAHPTASPDAAARLNRPAVPPGGRRESAAAIGPSVVIKGELSGSEDLTLDGHFEGQIELPQHALTVGPHAELKARIVAREVIVLGQVVGNIVASETVDIREHGAVEGDIASPSVAMVPGAHFQGSIDMRSSARRSTAATDAVTAEAGKPPSAASPATRPEPSKADAVDGDKTSSDTSRSHPPAAANGRT